MKTSTLTRISQSGTLFDRGSEQDIVCVCVLEGKQETHHNASRSSSYYATEQSNQLSGLGLEWLVRQWPYLGSPCSHPQSQVAISMLCPGLQARLLFQPRALVLRFDEDTHSRQGRQARKDNKMSS